MGAHNHVMKKFGFHQKNLVDIKHRSRGAWVMMQRSFREEITDEKMKKKWLGNCDHYAKILTKEVSL